MILIVVISFLAVFLFFLLLHLYAKKLLPQVDETNQTPRMLVVGARVRIPSSFHRNANNNGMINLMIKGLEPCAISAIPRFVFQDEEQGVMGQLRGLECVICLSSFENGQVGRRLPYCNHAFHVECIDMWLHSHTTCPICRASALPASSLPEDEGPQESAQRPSYSRETSGEVTSRLEVIVEVPSVDDQ